MEFLTTEQGLLIKKVIAAGEIVHAISLDLREQVASEAIDHIKIGVQVKEQDQIFSRKIKTVYLSEQELGSTQSTVGQFLIIEFDETDEHGATLDFDPGTSLTFMRPLHYRLFIEGDIETIYGKKWQTPVAGMPISREQNPQVDRLLKKTFEYDDYSLNYRLFQPAVVNKSLPLIVFLHGAGERGLKNEVHVRSSEGVTTFVNEDFQKQHPCYILAPQSRSVETLDYYWTDPQRQTAVIQLIQHLIKKQPIDPQRIYLVGMSMGGIGTFAMIRNYPGLFAAGVPICGIANIQKIVSAPDAPTYATLNRADVLPFKDVPLWLFHGVDDPVISVKNSQTFYQLMKEMGSKNIHYTELAQGTGHASWIPAFQNKKMKEWLLAQSQ